MKHGILSFVALIAISAFVFVGCTHTEKVVTKHVSFQVGDTKVDIANPQDTAFEELTADKSTGVIRIKKYRSSGNEAAIAAKEKEIENTMAMWQAIQANTTQTVRDAIREAAAYFSGRPSPAPTGLPVAVNVPATVVLTNAPAR